MTGADPDPPIYPPTLLPRSPNYLKKISGGGRGAVDTFHSLAGPGTLSTGNLVIETALHMRPLPMAGGLAWCRRSGGRQPRWVALPGHGSAPPPRPTLAGGRARRPGMAGGRVGCGPWGGGRRVYGAVGCATGPFPALSHTGNSG